MEVFRSQGAGHLVLISSVASVRGMPGSRTAYGASKAAVNSLAEGIRSDVWGSGIVVTTILPGYIATDINVGRRGPVHRRPGQGCRRADRRDRARAGEGVRAGDAVDAGRPAAAGAAALGGPPPHRSLKGPSSAGGPYQQIRMGRPRLSVAPSPTHSALAARQPGRRPRGGAGVQRVDHRHAGRGCQQGLLDVHDPAQGPQPLHRAPRGALPVAHPADRARNASSGCTSTTRPVGGSPSASSSARMALTSWNACAEMDRPDAASAIRAGLGVVVGSPARPAPAPGRPSCRPRRAGVGRRRRRRGRRRPRDRSACRWRSARRRGRRGPRRRRGGPSSVTRRPSSRAPTQRPRQPSTPSTATARA